MKEIRISSKQKKSIKNMIIAKKNLSLETRKKEKDEVLLTRQIKEIT